MPTPCPEGREIKGGQNPPNASDWRPPKPGGSKPQSAIYATPGALLKAVHDLGFAEERGSLQDHHCRYCDAWLDKCGAHEPEPHAESCLFFQIADYLKEHGQL